MKIFKKVIFASSILIFCLLLALSVLETVGTRSQTKLDQNNISIHIQKLTENGPRSILDKAANQKAIQYIISELEKYGAANTDSTDSFAYLVQDYVAEDTEGIYQNFYLQNVIVHIPASSDTPSGKAALFMAHVDSVPTSDGAADDAVACATMLEAIRYYSSELSKGLKTENDLVFCFVNGEEFNLMGSRAFINEFKGFNFLPSRIEFAANLESRGTSGTLVMFETSDRNLNTVKLFSSVNENVFACSTTNMIYNMMPNSTDFSNLKELYQGINLANIGGGENYHTKNDNLGSVNEIYASQQAHITEGLIEKLSVCDLDTLDDANSSAIYFSYLDLFTVAYDNFTAVILALVGLLLLIANILLSIFYRKQKNLKKTLRAIGCILGGAFVSAGIAYASYILFGLIAALFGSIDIRLVGSIAYSNTSIAVGMILLSLAVSVFTVRSECSLCGISRRDMSRAFAYIHVALGIILTFTLTEASYLFMISGIMLMINELLITLVKKHDLSELHLELLASAINLPIILPITLLTVSAIGLWASHAYCFIFSLILFGAGIALEPILKYVSLRPLISKLRKKKISLTSSDGAALIASIAMIIFLLNSVARPNASVNLVGNQGVSCFPYDDALIYVEDGDNTEYRIYDLNAYPHLKKYAPNMKYVTRDGESYYRCSAEPLNTGIDVLSEAISDGLAIKMTSDDSIVYVTVSSSLASSFTLNDGITSREYPLNVGEARTVIVHSDCTLTVNGGAAEIKYVEIVRDVKDTLPNLDLAEGLQLNLWLVEAFSIE